MKEFIIVGLGNPQEKYKRTRHNIGYLFLDYLHAQSEVPTKWIEKENFTATPVHIGDLRLHLVKPTMGMNLSGRPLIELAKLPNSNFIVIYDDIDMDFSKVRIKKANSGHGGHNGIKSIMASIGNNFNRIKLGVSRPEEGEVIDWVLSNFKPEEVEKLEEIFESTLVKLLALIKEETQESDDSNEASKT